MDYRVILKIDHVDTEKCSVVLDELSNALRRSRVAGNISVSMIGGESPEGIKNGEPALHVDGSGFLK